MTVISRVLATQLLIGASPEWGVTPCGDGVAATLVAVCQ